MYKSQRIKLKSHMRRVSILPYRRRALNSGASTKDERDGAATKPGGSVVASVPMNGGPAVPRLFRRARARDDRRRRRRHRGHLTESFLCMCIHVCTVRISDKQHPVCEIF